jgi:hypothetical protein
MDDIFLQIIVRTLPDHFYYRVMHPVGRIIKVVSETALLNGCLRCFIHILSQHVSAILRRIVQIIQRSYYSYNGSVVFSTNLIMHVSCKQLLQLFLFCIKFKYFVKIFKY